jgi:hypothetical protein
MENLEINPNEIKRHFLQSFNFFIDFETKLDSETKKQLIKDYEIFLSGINFTSEKLIEKTYDYAIYKWREDNQKTIELWKQIAVNASSHSVFPHIIADETIIGMKKTFNL